MHIFAREATNLGKNMCLSINKKMHIYTGCLCLLLGTWLIWWYAWLPKCLHEFIIGKSEKSSHSTGYQGLESKVFDMGNIYAPL